LREGIEPSSPDPQKARPNSTSSDISIYTYYAGSRGRKKFQLPISTSLYTELRFAISDYMQRHEWVRLFEACRTDDDEASRTFAVIMAGYEPKNVWQFLDSVANTKSEFRQQKSGSVLTCCYIIGKMGQTNVKKSLSYLRQFLVENPLMRDPVSAALSNLWVLNTRTTASVLLNDWILKNDHDEALQEASVSSCEYLASNDPKSVSSFLLKVSALEQQGIAATTANQLVKKYLPPNVTKPKKDLKRKKHKSKKSKKKKTKQKKHKKKK
jgi:hypothetical protein